MRNLKSRQIKNTIILNYRMFVLLFFTVPLYLINNRFIKFLGYLSIISLFLFTIVNVIFFTDKININKTWLWLIVYIFYNMIMLIRTPNFNAVYAFIIQIIMMLFLCLLSSSRISSKAMNTIFKLGKLICFIILVPVVIIAINSNMKLSAFNNYFGYVVYKFIMPCSFFYLANSKKKFYKVFLFSFLYFLMIERTSSVVIIIIYLVYLLLGKIRQNKTIFKLLFITIFISTIIFSYIYTQLQYMQIGKWLNEISRIYTGGNFFSGRNYIWEIAFNYFRMAPLFGYGIDHNILKSSGLTYSTHNVYIYLLLQGGIVNLSIFFFFMYSVWNRYFHFLEDDIVRLSAAYLIGILFFINFELTLIINSVGLGLFLWFIIGLGLIQRNNLQLENET